MSDIYKLILALHSSKPWSSWRSQPNKVQTLRSISEIGTPFTISSIFQFVFSGNKSISLEAAIAVRDLISKTKLSQWTKLYPSFQYINISESQLRKLRQFPSSLQIHLLGIASLNGNGYIRQEAVQALQSFTSPEKIPYIMLRLSDWVSQVRNVAEFAFSECLKKEYAEAFLSYVCIIDSMTRVERFDLSLIEDQITLFLTSEDSVEHLQKALGHSDTRVRLFCYRLLLRKSLGDLCLIEKGARDTDSKVRSLVLQKLQDTPIEHKIKYFYIFLRDPSPKICSAVMMSIPEAYWQEFRNIIVDNIFNKSASIRNTARFLLQKHEDFDFAVQYRKRIKAGLVSQGTLSGLAETGSEEDFDVLIRFTDYSRSKARAAALAGLHRLNPKLSIPLLIKALRDPAARVRRASCKILCKYRHYDRNLVRQIFKDGAANSKITALRVLCDSLDWDSLEDIFLMIADKEECVRNAAWSIYVKWFQRRSVNNWVKPSRQVLYSLEAKLKEFDSMPVNIPDLVAEEWRGLPVLLESGKKIWKLGK